MTVTIWKKKKERSSYYRTVFAEETQAAFLGLPLEVGMFTSYKDKIKITYRLLTGLLLIALSQSQEHLCSSYIQVRSKRNLSHVSAS